MKENIQMVPLSELHPFPENPFRVQDDAEMQEMMESVRDYGVLTPLIVRPHEGGGYEIISGHRRAKACEKAGIDKVPAFIRELDRDTAIIALVDSNLHREHILPGEKALAYKMKLDAIKRQGQRTDLTSRQVVGKSESADIVGSDAGDSGRQVQRFVRLTELIPPVLDKVNDGKIAFGPAVELSYLSQQEQADLLETMESEDCTPSLSQAQRLKKMSANGKLNEDTILQVMTEEKPNQKEQIKLKAEKIQGFFPKGYTTQQMEEVIMKLLSEWQKKRQRSRNDEAR